MLKYRFTVFTAALGLLLGGAHAATPAAGNSGSNTSGASAGQQASGTAATTTIEVPVVVLVPVQVRADPNFANGCWVRLFDGPDFKGKDELTIAGPIDMQTLKTPSGINWKRKADSLTVGPKASVQVFENEFFRDKTLTLKPGQQVPSLRKELGFLHSIDSLKVNCTR
jgi:hypothetical protein